jgi:protein-export membrane protein SecD
MRGYRLWLVVTLVVAAISIWVSLPDNPGIHFGGINQDIAVVQGLDLQGGSRVLLEAAPGVEYSDDAMDQAAKIVENRVNGLGVSEAVVQQQEGGRIIVELPGVREERNAFDAIRSVGLLEFVDFSTEGSTLPEGSCVLTDRQVELARARLQEGESELALNEYTCAAETVDGTADPATLMANGQPFHTVMTGAGLDGATAQVNNSGVTQWVVNFSLKDSGDGVSDFVDYLANNSGRPLAIVLDGRLLSAPTINPDLSQSAQIDNVDGGVITGRFTRNEAKVLAAQLQYGSLPVPLDIIAYDTIGPTLGKISVERSIRAGIIGIITVLLFMLIYYRVPGIAAALALLLFAAINFSLFKLIPVTMSLPAITGFLISIGTAVDGNILIFERMKEELRGGRSMERGIEAGFDRAWTSIWVSNLSTIIICGILYVFGSAFGASQVRGFAVTLFLGLLINLFTAVIVTRTLLHTIVIIAGNQLRNRHKLLGV